MQCTTVHNHSFSFEVLSIYSTNQPSFGSFSHRSVGYKAFSIILMSLSIKVGIHNQHMFHHINNLVLEAPVLDNTQELFFSQPQTRNGMYKHYEASLDHQPLLPQLSQQQRSTSSQSQPASLNQRLL